MSYRTQPTKVAAGLTTTVAINTDTTTNLIAAPAVGFILRIAYIRVAAQQSVTGHIRMIFRSTGSGQFISNGSVGPGLSFIDNLPEPGESCAPNIGFDCIYASEVASQSIRVIVGYFLEAIS